jgi:hypothetical protein
MTVASFPWEWWNFPILQTPQAFPGLGAHTGVHEVHLPIHRLLTVMDRRQSTSKINRDVFVEGIEVEEVLLDHFPLVAERNDEFVVT